MKFLLMSDNHGFWPKVNEICQHYKGQVDYYFHCGDSEFQFDDPIWEYFDAKVTGNMDFDPQYPATVLFDTPEGQVLLAHGHLHNGHVHNRDLVKLAKEQGAKFLFHGHTHVLYAQIEEGILCVNPGSLKRSRGPQPDRTYAIVTVEPKVYQVDFYNDNLDLIPSLTQIFSRGESHNAPS